MGTKEPMTPAEAMRFDPMTEVERITGKSYKDDKVTSDMGLAMHLMHVQRTKRIMEAAGDSRYAMNAVEFQYLIQAHGFECVADEVVKSDRHWMYWHAYWRTPGQLMLCEYLDWNNNAPSAMIVNSATCYYNWKPSADTIKDRNCNWYEATSSGGWHREDDADDDTWRPTIWSGDHDAREGIITKLNRLEELGTFIEPWVDTPHLWAVVGQLESPERFDFDFDYHGVTVARLRAQLPTKIKEFILLEAYDSEHQAIKARNEAERAARQARQAAQ